MMKGLSSALEGAFAVVLGQNALLLARVLYEILIHQISQDTIIILLFCIINISAVAANWVSCRQKGNDTTDLSFFLDIITLSVFFGVSYILNDNYIAMTKEKLLLVISICYILIHFLFILWNVIMIKQNFTCNYMLMKSNYKNLFAICLYILIFMFRNHDIAYYLFLLTFLYWIYLIYFYLYNLDSVTIPVYINRAEWFSPEKRIFKQYLISFKSYLTKIFAKYHNDAAKNYFSNIYNGKYDAYLFDGKEKGYLNCLIYIKDILKNRNIIDLGCGTGSLYRWMKKNDIPITSYTGVDFAVKPATINKQYEIKNENVEFYSAKYDKNNIVIAINLLCYLSDNQFEQLRASLTYTDYFIIIEPSKSLFWDAYFDDVQLFYRKRKKLIKLLLSNNFEIKSIAIDYGLKCFHHYFLELSNCLVFQKNSD